MPYLSVDPAIASEGAGSLSFVIRLDAATLNEVRVNYTTSNGTAVGNFDVQGQSGTLTFGPGETRKTVTVLLLNDTGAEKTEAFWLNLSGAVNATITQASATGLIFDNDQSPGRPAISVRGGVFDESDPSALFVVSLDRPSLGPVSVAYGTRDASAVAGQDYVAGSGLLNFAPGETVKTVSVALLNDGLAEDDEFFELLLSNPGNANLAGEPGLAMIGRNDADPVATPYVRLSPVAVGEGDVFADFVVQLSAPSRNEVRVNFSTSNGTAVGNFDVQGRSGTIVFAPGVTTQVVRTLLIDDSTAERSEGFWLNLSGAVNATLEQASTTATIYDDDGNSGTPAISIGDQVVDETAGIATLVVSLDRPSLSTVNVEYLTADDLARAGQDYVASAGALSFAPGEVAKTVTVRLIDDTRSEIDESFQVLLANPSQARLGDAAGAVLIGRSDTAPVSQPQITARPVVASEGDLYTDMLVQLSAPSPNQVRVNFSTANGTAVGNFDVQGRSGTLVFAPGETTQVVRLMLIDDTTVEPTESFWFDLGGAVNATIPQSRVAVTITDDDGATTFSGGIGNDQYTVGSAADRIAESPYGGIDTVRSSVSYVLPENVENLILLGSAGLSATGNGGNNRLRGNSGNNLLDGQGGIDSAVFTGRIADYSITAGANNTRLVAGAGEGSDTLVSIERLQFADTIRASDTTPGGNTYAAYALFNAGFDRGPTTAELSLWTSTLDRLGGNTRELAQTMINHYAPGVPDEALVAHLWGTIVGGSISPEALAQYAGLLANGSFTQASLLDFVASLSFNTDEIVAIVGTTLALDPADFPFG
jgi:hypothetical protein